MDRTGRKQEEGQAENGLFISCRQGIALEGFFGGMCREFHQPPIEPPSPGNIQGMPKESQMPTQDHDQHTSRPGLRTNRSDPLDDLQLLPDVDAINERTMHVLGSLPAGGLPAQKGDV